LSAGAKKILDAALKLDPAERIHVAELIWQSVATSWRRRPSSFGAKSSPVAG
jgi:hypothetical protein